MRGELGVTPEQVIMKLDLMKAGRNQGQMGWRNCHPRCTLKPDAVSPCGENQFWGAHSPEVWGERRTPPCLGGGSSLLPSDKILSVDDSRRQVRRLRARWVRCLSLSFLSGKMGIIIPTFLFLGRLNEIVFAENTGTRSWYPIYNVFVFLYKWCLFL